MDYDSDSSDFHFPTDTGLPKLSSPLSFKVPESRDWAYEEFIQTLQDKPCTDAENLLSFKQYIPIHEDEDSDTMDFNFGPPKVALSTFEEKDLLQQLSQHFMAVERLELRDILKGGFTLVQNDIQSNNTIHHPQINKQQGLSWFNEANDYDRPHIESLDSIKEEKKSFRLYEHAPVNKPLPPLPVTVEASVTEEPKPSVSQEPKPSVSQEPKPSVSEEPKPLKKGLKQKIKSKLFIKSENKKPSVLKKWMRKLLPVS